MNNQVKYIYICSSANSGSTLLDLLLGSHSQIASLGEISHLSKNISLNTQCTCGKHVLSCPLWKQVVSILNRKLGTDVFADPYALNMGYPNPKVVKDKLHDLLSYKLERKFRLGLRYAELKYRLYFMKYFLNPLYESIENNISVYDAVRKVIQCEAIVDSSKYYLKAIGIYNRIPDHVRILLLCRDGRGVMYSAIKRNFPRDKRVSGWQKYYERAIPLLKEYVDSDHLLSVKYEDIVQDPTVEIGRICNFLNLKFENTMLDFASHVHHITNGNDMRFSKSSEIRADNAWKDKLSKADLIFFDRKAGELNRYLGYV